MSRSNLFAVQQRKTSNNLGVSLLLSINEQSTLFTFYILVVLILHVKYQQKKQQCYLVAILRGTETEA